MLDSCCCTLKCEFIAIRKRHRLSSVYDPSVVYQDEEQSNAFFFSCVRIQEAETTQSVYQPSSFVVRTNWNDEATMIHVCVFLLIPI